MMTTRCTVTPYHGLVRRTCDVKIERDGIEAASSQHLRPRMERIGEGHSLPLASRKLPEKPLQSIRPIYQIQVANPYQRTFVNPPLARCHTAHVSLALHVLAQGRSNLTSPSLIPPSRSLMIECDRANTDQDDGSKLAPYE